MSTPYGAFDRIVEALERSGAVVKMYGVDRVEAQCPAHDDQKPSLGLKRGYGQALLLCRAGCATQDVLAAFGLTMADIYDNRRGVDYPYDNGRVVHRKPDKSFPQSGANRPPELYRLAKVQAAVAADQPIYVVEGEKNVHALEGLGVAATCSPMGAANWDKVDPSPLAGAKIVLVPDLDLPGLRNYGAAVVRTAELIGASVSVVAVKINDVADDAADCDIADHIAAGYGLDDLVPTTLSALYALYAPETTASVPPPVLADAAYQGVIGRIVRAVAPHTEADPAAVLFTLLAVMGAVLGRGSYILAGDAQHPARLWPLIIGKTAGGMKGTSWAAVQRVLLAAVPSFAANIDHGLSSGEGLIERVRDSVGDPTDEKTFIEGTEDKRLLVVETEFAAVLDRGKRDGNTLSEVQRQAWDGTTLSTMTRKINKLRSTDPHIVIIGHITETELRKKVTTSDLAGGLVNRYLPVYSARSKRLPDGGSVPDVLVKELGGELVAAIERADGVHCQVERDQAAAQHWRALYRGLTPDTPDGMLASVVARAAPQVLRIALTYALLDVHDGDVRIRVEHIDAALAAWHYVEATARLVFGEGAADPDMIKLTTAIEASGSNGMTRTEVHSLFDGHKTRAELAELLRRATTTGRYEASSEGTGGRPITRYLAVAKRDKRVKREKVGEGFPKPPAAAVNTLYALNAHNETPGTAARSVAPLLPQPTPQAIGETVTGDRTVGARREVDSGFCSKCGKAIKRYGEHGSPLCEDCRATQ